MSVQTSVSSNPSAAYEGQIDGDAVYQSMIITKIANPSGGLSAGRGLVYVSGSDTKCDLPAASTDITGQGKFQGVAIFNPSIVGSWPTPTTTGIYQQGQLVSILRRGRIWVYVDGAVAITDGVYCRYASGTGTVNGRFFNGTDTSSCAQVSNARFLTHTSGAGLVLIEINPAT